MSLDRTQKRFRLTPPRPFIPTEFEEQCQIFEYARVAGKQDPRWKLLFATMNGVRVSIGLAKKMKRAGNNSGVPDLILPIPETTVGFHGLYVELKRIKLGVLSDEQKWWHERLIAYGYHVVTCKGAVQAINAINAYLETAANYEMK